MDQVTEHSVGADGETTVDEGLRILDDIAQKSQNTFQELAIKADAERQQGVDRSQAIMNRYYAQPVVDSDRFYRRHFPTIVNAAINETLRDNGSPLPLDEIPDIASVQERLKAMTPAEIDQAYRELHNEGYLVRVATIAEALPVEKRVLFSQAPYTVCIAARNESDLMKTYNAIKESYGPEFETDVAILIYHNYVGDSGAIPEEVTTSVHGLSEQPNVLVAEESVPVGTKVSEAKKVAADIATHLIPSDKNPTILFTDADLVGLTPQAIQKSKALLDEKEFVGAVTTAQNPDPQLKDTFPLLFQYLTLNNDVNDYMGRNGLKKPRTIGSFTFTDKLSFQACGGWIPEELHEDMQFSTQLALLSRSRHPVIDGGIVADPVKAYFNPNREVEALLASLEGSRFSEANYTLLSGQRRISWKDIPTAEVEDIPLLAAQDSADSLEVVINIYIGKNLPRQIGEWSPARYSLSTAKHMQQGIADWLRQRVPEDTLCTVLDLDTHEHAQCELKELTTESLSSKVILHIGTPQ